MTMTMTAESLSFFDMAMDGEEKKARGFRGDAGRGLFVCAEYYRMRGIVECGKIVFLAQEFCGSSRMQEGWKRHDMREKVMREKEKSWRKRKEPDL